MAGGGDGGVAVLAHLPLVLADGRDDVGAVRSGGQRTAEQCGVAKGGVGAGAAGRAHRVDGVTQHGDATGRPWRRGRRDADPDAERLVDLGLGVQGPQVGVPGPDQLGGQGVQPGRVHRAELLVRHAEHPAIPRHGPHQVVRGGCQPECLGRLAEADDADRHADAPADHGSEPVLDGGGDLRGRRRTKRSLAVDAARPGVGRLGVRQVLAADRGAHAVRADQHVGSGLLAAREVQPHAAVAGFVPGQLVAERDPVTQAGRKHFPERQAVDRRGQGGRCVGVGAAGDLLMQHPQLFAHHGQAPAGLAAGGLERYQGFGRQARLQGQAGPRVHVQPVALPPTGQAGVPLVDGDVGARPEQALRQAQPAESGPGHCHPESVHGSGWVVVSRAKNGSRPVARIPRMSVWLSPGCRR